MNNNVTADTLAKMLALMDAVAAADKERRPLTTAEQKLLPSAAKS